MKITKRQLQRIIREEKKRIAESYNSMSPRSSALANSIKRKFMKMYPDAKVGIDGRKGWITVNGQKAVNMSQASASPMSDEEMINQMHAIYAGNQVDPDVPTADSRMDTFKEGKMKITKRQLRRIIREEKARLLSEAMTRDDLQDELEEINQIVVKLFSALDAGGYETPDMGGPDAEQQEHLRMFLDNVQYELDSLETKLGK
jgi:hypothetical protein